MDDAIIGRANKIMLFNGLSVSIEYCFFTPSPPLYSEAYYTTVHKSVNVFAENTNHNFIKKQKMSFYNSPLTK